MRPALPLLLLAIAVVAQPPKVEDFRRMKELRSDMADRHALLKDREEYALKPREEKMLILFDRGEEKFEGKKLDGASLVVTILKWDQVNQEPPTEAGKRVLADLPNVLFRRYGQAIEVPRDRKEVCLKLCDALDSDFTLVRASAFDALKKIYRTPSGFMYNVDMTKKERQDPIKSWKNYVKKQK
ncbi:MAG TPA: hypothetical protein VFY93_12300 [Planctomycetota bacterium]|nr:hypothetical protein [Planctomycetota bacterium]